MKNLVTTKTIPDVIDNSTPERRLADVLNQLMTPGASVYIACGFFNPGGYALLRQGLNRAAQVRILLGKEPPAVGIDAGALPLASQLSEDMESYLHQAMATGRRQEHDQVRDLLAFLQRETVEVRRYTPRFFHAKAYILRDVPPFGTIAIVGSSNLTAAGLTANTELNMVQKQAAVAQDFLAWFERFWAEAQDYKPELIDLYTRATALYEPYLIYMKALYEALADRLGGDIAPIGNRPSPIALADFQHDGYLAAKDILETYGGVLIADPVGFGKTYLALRLLDDYAYQLRQKALVVCPAQLRDIWWGKKLEAYRIYAQIESQERVSQTDFLAHASTDYDLVIVDECHNFRNPNANRYQNLSKLLSMGKNKKLVLLTATPINTGVLDLYHQMRLITGGRDDFFAGIGIGSLRSYFVQAETNREALHDLLEAVAVRRSREFIRRNYPEAEIDGQRIRFPERQLHTVHYNLEETYEGLYDEASAAIEHLNLAPYLLDFYRQDLLEKQRSALRAGDFSGVSQDLAMILGRQAALVSILKMLYLKRLESSVAAFKISIERQVRFQKEFLEQLKAGKLLSSRAFQRIESVWRQLEDDDSLAEKERQEAEEKADQAVAEIVNQLEPVNPADYDIASIQVAIEQDIRSLQTIYDRLAPAGPREDDKFLALQQLLTGELRGKKVVVFTYFKDTARYLYRNLREDISLAKTQGHGQLSITDSGIKPEELRDRIIRFAPHAHDRPDLIGSEREIRLLISTDVLSEGQNLQDADTVVNYDLHWNPIRMIQRIGRLDRLGSPHSRVHTYNFVPEDALESLIGLMKRLRDRLEAINRAGLLDAPVLGEVPTPQDFNALRRIAQGDESIWQELESLSELDIGEFLKQEMLDFLKQVGEEKLKKLPPGVGSGKRAPNGRRGLFVHLKGGSQYWWLFYDLGTKHFLERKLEVIKLVRCRENETLVPPDFDVYPIIEQAKRHVVSRLRQAQVKLPRLRTPQNHILNWLKTQRADDVIQPLLRYFAEPLPETYLQRLRKIWQAHRNNGPALFQALQAFVRDNPYTPPQRPDVQQLTEDELTVVCYMALV